MQKGIRISIRLLEKVSLKASLWLYIDQEQNMLVILGCSPHIDYLTFPVRILCPGRFMFLVSSWVSPLSAPGRQLGA